MTIREELEELEYVVLCPGAAKSRETLGRDHEEEPCDMRTAYQRDRDRILHSKSFRRLSHKTQVFISPQGDHYRTRLTHTLEVSQLSRTIAKALRLNEDLADAIALGHDLGHTPFGHAGERALADICPLGFKHADQSVRIVEKLEKKGRGLNLTHEVRDGIANHRTSGHPRTMEGQAVRLCDKIAYINHDIDDAERGGILREEDIPCVFRETLGFSTRERLNTLVHDVINHSRGEAEVSMSPQIAEVMGDLRRFMFEHVYFNPEAKREEVRARRMLQSLYEYYIDHTDELGPEYLALIEERGEKKERVVCDYISGMTDQYASYKFAELFIPRSWGI